jgi:rod shape determining protein RodA
MRIRDFLKLDFTLLLSVAALIVFGILSIYSAGINTDNVLVSDEYSKQIVWAAIGTVLALVLAFSGYRRIYYIAAYLYVASILLLLYTCVMGRVVNGARAWIGIGSFGIQPSELTKITTIIFLAWYLDFSKRGGSDVSRFLISTCIVLLPMGLILIQPDFGTSLVFIPILLTMAFIAGIAVRYIVFALLSIGLAGILMVLPLWQTYIYKRPTLVVSLLQSKIFFSLAIGGLFIIFLIALFGYRRFKKRYYYWLAYFVTIALVALVVSFLARKFLKEYQIMRLIVFLDPNVDPRGSGWNIIQSITSIGSGGIWGKGYLQGTQSHYRFLPQQSTDFIFSIFLEEWGLVGGLVVFVLFLIISFRFVNIMKNSQNDFGSYIVAGLSGMFAFHFMINIGMTMGIMPITGIPLIFMSYGGSSLISAMLGIGLAESIYIGRYQK